MRDRQPPRVHLMVAMIVATAVAGCLDDGGLEDQDDAGEAKEAIDYTVPKPDDALGLIETQHLFRDP